jgi:uncharacterized protein YdaU (DUF1376 family)
MSKLRPWLPLYVADYLADTKHLNTEQHGAYLLLLMAMWRSEDATLPNEPKLLARISGIRLCRWHLVAPDVMSLMTIERGRVTQKRLRQEFQHCISISTTKAAAGRKGAERRYSASRVTEDTRSEHKPLKNNGGRSAYANTPTSTSINNKKESLQEKEAVGNAQANHNAPDPEITPQEKAKADMACSFLEETSRQIKANAATAFAKPKRWRATRKQLANLRRYNGKIIARADMTRAPEEARRLYQRGGYPSAMPRSPLDY